MDSYGKKCNSKFLLHYGFTIESNREQNKKCQNEVSIIFDLEQYPLLERRIRLIHPSLHCRVTMNAEDPGTVDAFGWARVAVATALELSKFENPNTSYYRALNASNEMQAIRLVADICKHRLSQYPTSIADDNEKLCCEGEGKLEPFCNQRSAIIAVRGEKEIFQFYISLADYVEKIIYEPQKRRKERILKYVNSNSNIDISRFICTIHEQLLSCGH
eukprot:GSMAST32.ASY1.ANO1.22.1 assembled CDS